MLLEYFDEYFHTETLKESPYMSYAIKVREEKIHEISSIVHHDYTCRIQTVTEEQNKNYYNLIKAWHEETGCPIIFNTSFNLGGEAMVETIEDAMDTCKRSMINFIYVPIDQDLDLEQYRLTEEELEKMETGEDEEEAVEKKLITRADFGINPGSEQVRFTAERDGLLDPFIKLDAKIFTNACGPCNGQCYRVGSEKQETIKREELIKRITQSNKMPAN